MRKWILSLLLTGVAHGSVTYQFTYTQSSGTIQSFSAVFTSATFFGGTTGSETSLTPFNVTDGTTNWSITKYRPYNIIGPECYLFGTASVSLTNCSSNSLLSGDGSFFVGFLSNPSTTGTFTPDFWGGSFLGGAGGSISSSTGTMTLTITDPSLITCTGVANNPLVRGEDYTALVGDIFINCTGGIPTALGSTVPKVDIVVSIPTTTITSKITDASVSPNFNEVLLIIDNAGSASSGSTFPILNCGSAGAPFGVSPFSCDILGVGGPGATTYNGTAGRPNVFQARQFPTSAGTAIQFLGVPLDPRGNDGITNSRTMRITNLRVNAAALGITGSGAFGFITSTVNFSGPNFGGSQFLSNMPIATVRGGMVVSSSSNSSPANFLQCTATAGNAKKNITITEGFSTAFKVRNWEQIQDNGAPPGFGGGDWQYASGARNWTSTDVNQNVPNALYNTESGFMFPPGASDPAFSNPPPATGPSGASPAGTAFSDVAGVGGIEKAGTVTQGTRIAIRFSAAPLGSNPSVPNFVNLTSSSVITGVMALVIGADVNGAGGLPTTAGGTSLISTLPGGFAVYEVLFSAPSAIETATITVTVAPAATPAVAELTATASFAPFYAAGTGANLATQMTSTFDMTTGSFPVGRFLDTVQGPVAVYDYSECATLTGLITNKSGPANARTWTISVIVTNPVTAIAAQITGLTLTQTFGAACTPVILTPLPVTIGDLPAFAGSGNVTIDFSGCPAIARFTAVPSFSATNAASGSKTLYNQFR